MNFAKVFPEQLSNGQLGLEEQLLVAEPGASGTPILLSTKRF
jgi:hypothetical protein